jgi:hypothetical protein
MQLEAMKHTFDVTTSIMVCVEFLAKLPLNVIKKLQEASVARRRHPIARVD